MITKSQLIVCAWSLATVTFLGAAIALQVNVPQLPHSREFLKPPEKIKYFTFGYNDFMSGALWLRLVQNIDYCEEGAYQESDYVEPTQPIGKNRLAGILARKMKPSRCHKGWSYSMMNSISEIDPKFKLVYDPGATILSVNVDDREGARLMYEKGLIQYPEDWRLYFKAAYHYMWEEQNAQRAGELYNKAARYGAPEWVSALSASLYTIAGQAQIAKLVLEDALRSKPRSEHAERIKQRLDEVNQILKEKE